MEALKGIIRGCFYTKRTPASPGESEYTFSKTRTFVTAMLTGGTIGGILLYRYDSSLKNRASVPAAGSIPPLPTPLPQIQPPAAPTPPSPAPLISVDSVVTEALKEHYPEVKLFLLDLQKQIQMGEAPKSFSYQLRQSSGRMVELHVDLLPRANSRLQAVMRDPLPHYQLLCEAIEKIIPAKGVSLRIELAREISALPPTPVSFPAELTVGVTPHPDLLLAAVEKQLQQKILKLEEYCFYREGVKNLFVVLLPRNKGTHFPSSHSAILTGQPLYSDPLFPALMNALKATVYKVEGKYPVFALFYQ